MAWTVSGCGGTASVPPSNSSQATTVYTFPAGKGGQLISPNFNAVEGNLFEVTGGRNIIVTALGYEDERGAAQQVATTAIFDSNGNILASASISGASTLSDGYFWQPINPITLIAGRQYYIGSLHGSGNASTYIWNTQVASTPGFISDMGTYFKVSSTIGGGSWQFGGGTSQYGSGEIRHYVGNFKSQLAGP